MEERSKRVIGQSTKFRKRRSGVEEGLNGDETSKRE
jgi:hypothetical protein